MSIVRLVTVMNHTQETPMTLSLVARHLYLNRCSVRAMNLVVTGQFAALVALAFVRVSTRVRMFNVHRMLSAKFSIGGPSVFARILAWMEIHTILNMVALRLLAYMTLTAPKMTYALRYQIAKITLSENVRTYVVDTSAAQTLYAAVTIINQSVNVDLISKEMLMILESVASQQFQHVPTIVLVQIIKHVAEEKMAYEIAQVSVTMSGADLMLIAWVETIRHHVNVYLATLAMQFTDVKNHHNTYATMIPNA